MGSSQVGGATRDLSSEPASNPDTSNSSSAPETWTSCFVVVKGDELAGVRENALNWAIDSRVIDYYLHTLHDATDDVSENLINQSFAIFIESLRRQFSGDLISAPTIESVRGVCFITSLFFGGLQVISLDSRNA